jgi:hypothetical protein
VLVVMPMVVVGMDRHLRAVAVCMGR